METKMRPHPESLNISQEDNSIPLSHSFRSLPLLTKRRFREAVKEESYGFREDDEPQVHPNSIGEEINDRYRVSPMNHQSMRIKTSDNSLGFHEKSNKTFPNFRHELGSRTDNQNQKVSKKLCKFLLSGKCLRGGSCLYSHEITGFPCKYFQGLGTCQAGNRCKYSHDPYTDTGKIIELVNADQHFFVRNFERLNGKAGPFIKSYIITRKDGKQYQPNGNHSFNSLHMPLESHIQEFLNLFEENLNNERDNHLYSGRRGGSSHKMDLASRIQDLDSLKELLGDAKLLETFDDRKVGKLEQFGILMQRIAEYKKKELTRSSPIGKKSGSISATKVEASTIDSFSTPPKAVSPLQRFSSDSKVRKSPNPKTNQSLMKDHIARELFGSLRGSIRVDTQSKRDANYLLEESAYDEKEEASSGRREEFEKRIKEKLNSLGILRSKSKD
eukprot:TRINITY_DN2179_c0_g1_i6.p1 TRINITY_DN2179_c0_g1~~TRINITY_DN2179_c0_g1_i6.p1  ORF type:complete len:443 (+),score=57.06 TRINITY_DN2179_c0_g1_i6:122-1450(+)